MQVKKEWRQKIFLIQRGHIGIVERAQETSSDTGVHNRAITVLYSPPQASNQLSCDCPIEVKSLNVTMHA